LIKSGAKLVQQWQDVVSELPPEISARILPPKLDEAKTSGKAPQPELAPADLSENERRIWSLLSADESKHIDVLLDESALSFGDLNGSLVALDLKDLIRSLPGNFYARKI
jgi:DNA processing protein